MVQKATQQLLFEVDWSGGGAVSGGIDVLVIDMPPGTGDVALTLGQLVIVDGEWKVFCPMAWLMRNFRGDYCLHGSGCCTC